MKSQKIQINPKERYVKYKSAMGGYYDELIDTWQQWEGVCWKSLTSPASLSQLLQDKDLVKLKQIDTALRQESGVGLEPFLRDMINAQHIDLIIPYLVITNELPEDLANVHIGLLGSGSDIFTAIQEVTQ